LVGTFGSERGIYSGTPGEVGDLKLGGLTGVGTDASGNIYVSLDGFNRSGTDLRKFNASGSMQWRLLGLQFVDNADADPGTDGVTCLPSRNTLSWTIAKAMVRNGAIRDIP
jgi:hypothetical protein